MDEIRIISVIGKKNSGKTSLVIKIVKELKRRGHSVSTIKHSHHKMEFDRENTDTYRHKEAGADLVIGESNNTFFNLSKELSLERLLFLAKFIEDPDFVVVEGFKDYKYPKIVTSKELSDDFTVRYVDSINITDEELNEVVDDIEKFSFDILNSLYSNECIFTGSESIGKAIVDGKINFEDTDVSLSIDEKVIGLNYFVNDFIKATVLGMLKSLKLKEYGAEKLEKVELLIKNKKK